MQHIYRHRLELGIDTDILISDIMVILSRPDNLELGIGADILISDVMVILSRPDNLELGIGGDILTRDVVVILSRLDRLEVGMFVMCYAAHTPPSSGIRYRCRHFDKRCNGYTVGSRSSGNMYVCDV
jgi:hypothetical protein